MRPMLHRTLTVIAAGTALLCTGALVPDFWTPAMQFGDQFQHSSACATCHANTTNATAMRDQSNRPIGMFDLWQSTMMANSARDPYYRATLSAEMARHPARASEIEKKCLGCHVPMSASGPNLDTELRMSLERVDANDALGLLASDGVSCTVCHSITPQDLGDESTFSGKFHVSDRGQVFGPHDALDGGRMTGRTGLIPVTSDHIKSSSGLCGSCHTLFTEPLAPDGTPVGTSFAEQTPYLEWRNSIYFDEYPQQNPNFENVDPSPTRSCQDCHLPTTDADDRAITTRVAHAPNGRDDLTLRQRSPYGRHLLVGGNTIIPEILRDNATALNVTAPAAAFDATIAAATDQLQNRTANLDLAAQRSGDDLFVQVGVENLAGHKFPTAYPARRAWIRLRVRNSSGTLIWTSGQWDNAGRITDAAGNPLTHEAAGGPILPHQNVVIDPNTPQVWESVMADSTGQPTFSLMSATRYLKDNRLLPKGWDPNHPDAVHTAPQGTAGDPDFRGGFDRVTFRVPAPASAGPYDVEAVLAYQPIAPRWAEELFTVNTPQVQAFRTYYQNATRTPTEVERKTLQAQ